MEKKNRHHGMTGMGAMRYEKAKVVVEEAD